MPKSTTGTATVENTGEAQNKKQGTRMLKVVCANGTGYTVRMTRLWIDTYGTPKCPCCNKAMVQA